MNRSAVRQSLLAFTPLLLGIGAATVLHLWVVPNLGERQGFYNKVLLDMGVNIILAVSLNIVNGFTGQFSIGHAGFMAVGGYTAASVTYYCGGASLWGERMLNPGILSWTRDMGDFSGPMVGAGDGLFLGACLIGGLVAAAVGFLVGLPSLRLRGDYLAIVTLGFGEIVRILIERTPDQLTTLEEVRNAPVAVRFTHVGGPLGLTGVPFYTTAFWVYAFVAVTLVVSYRLKQSSHGRALLAIREDPLAAETMGVPVTRYRVIAFILAAFFAGIAGGLYGHQLGVTLNPGDLGFQKSFDILIIVVLGGLGSISGAVVAAVILTLLPELLRTVVIGGVDLGRYRLIIYALLLVLMMVLRPKGLFGLREVWDFRPWGRWKGAAR